MYLVDFAVVTRIKLKLETTALIPPAVVASYLLVAITQLVLLPLANLGHLLWYKV